MSSTSPGSVGSSGGEPCPSCGVPLDIRGQALLVTVRCPRCRAEVRVRDRIGSYLLLSELGEGGCGRVFRARSSSDGEEVAIKVLERADPGFDERLPLFRNEAACVRKISHPCIVGVRALLEQSDAVLLVLELMEGGSLHDLIHSSGRGRVPEEKILRIVLRILKGLMAGWSAGILHRDLKPANILFTGGGAAKLCDYGLAAGPGIDSVPRDHLLATPDYASPEFLAGESCDFRSDLYGLGGCLYHALAGRPPHPTEGISLERLRKLKRSSPRLPWGIGTPATRRLVSRMLSPDPEGRYPTPEEALGEVLGAIGSAVSAGGRPPGNTGLLGRLFSRVVR